MMLMNISATRSTTARRSARSRGRRSARRVSRRPVVHSWILRRFGPRRARFPELRVEFRERRRRGPGAGATWPRDARRRADAVAEPRAEGRAAAGGGAGGGDGAGGGAARGASGARPPRRAVAAAAVAARAGTGRAGAAAAQPGGADLDTKIFIDSVQRCSARLAVYDLDLPEEGGGVLASLKLVQPSATCTFSGQDGNHAV